MATLLFVSVDAEYENDMNMVKDALITQARSWPSSLNLMTLAVTPAVSGEYAPVVPQEGRCTVSVDEYGGIHSEQSVEKDLQAYINRVVIEGNAQAGGSITVVGVAPANDIGGRTVLLMCDILSDCIRRICEVRVNIFLLLEQAVRELDRMRYSLSEVMRYNKKQVFGHIYLLPWDNDRIKQESVSSIVCACRAALVTPSATEQRDMTVETVTARRLSPPDKYIRDFFYRKLCAQFYEENFDEDFRSSAGRAEGNAADRYNQALTETRRKLAACAARLRLPPLSAIMAVMPVSDAYSTREIDDAGTPADRVLKLYGERNGRAIIEMIETDHASILSELSALSRTLYTGAINLILLNAERKGIRFAGIVDEDVRLSPEELMPNRRAYGDDGGAKRWSASIVGSKYVALARYKHELLGGMYQAACKRNDDQVAHQMRQAIGNALNGAYAFIGRLGKRIAQDMRALATAPLENDGSCFVDGVEEAYGHWWRVNPGTVRGGDGILKYLRDTAMLAEEGVDAEGIAESAVSKIREELDRRLSEITLSVQDRIGELFTEIEFRSALLADAGRPRDLYMRMRDELAGAMRHGILVYSAAGVKNISPQRCVFIIRDVSHAEPFIKIMKGDYTAEVVPDPAEQGIMMLVEYSGEVMDWLAVVKSMQGVEI